MRDNTYKQVACYRLLFQTTQPQDRRIITQTLSSPLRLPTSPFSHRRSSLAGFVHRLCLSPVSKHSHRATLRQFIQIKCINTQSLQKKENKRQEMGHVGLKKKNRIERLRHNAVNTGPRFPNRSPLTSIIPSGFLVFVLNLCVVTCSVSWLSVQVTPPPNPPPGRVRRCGTDTSKYDPQASLRAGSVLVHLQKNKYKHASALFTVVMSVMQLCIYLLHKAPNPGFFPKMEVESTRLLLAWYDRNI